VKNFTLAGGVLPYTSRNFFETHPGAWSEPTPVGAPRGNMKEVIMTGARKSGPHASTGMAGERLLPDVSSILLKRLQCPE
jgi:hypothetical protein